MADPSASYSDHAYQLWVKRLAESEADYMDPTAVANNRVIRLSWVMDAT